MRCSRRTRSVLACIALGVPLALGCTVPMPRVSPGVAPQTMGLTDAERQRVLGYQPAAQAPARPALRLPATIALAEVGGTQPYCGRNTDVPPPATVRLVQRDRFPSDKQLERLADLPQMRAAIRLDTRAIHGETTVAALRRLARAQRADLLLLYSFETISDDTDHALLATLFTLGVAPNHSAHADAGGTAVLIDANTGYLYGFAEPEAAAAQLANAHTVDEAEDDTRNRAQRRAFAQLVDHFEKAWAQVVYEYR